VIERIRAILKARNIEFMRDRASVGWNVFMPLVLVFGLSLVFSRDDTDQFIVAVIDDGVAAQHAFLATRYVDFTPAISEADAIRKVGRHQLDMLFAPGEPSRYWVNPDSPKGYIVERLLLQADPGANKETVAGEAVRYVDWLLPGVIGMNMMFSCLFGVGYVVVRYRKNGFLKRLRATPLNAFEFIAAQALSRLMLTMTISAFVFICVTLVLHVPVAGSWLALLLVSLIGCLALIAFSLVIAARATSEEFAGGLLNLMSWPMMMLSGVFYSLEGSAPWIQKFANVYPLTHMLTAARAIMIDGAGVLEIMPQLVILGLMAGIALLLGSVLFRWRFV
jgi:ABC-2 type transport system permease protein